MSAAPSARSCALQPVTRCVQVYWALGFMLLYGEFATERERGPYYQKQGFEVLGPGQTTDVGYVLTGRSISRAM
jgi:hypothetical protein